MCNHRYEGDGATCQRKDIHDEAATGGHVYHASNGSDVPDRHTERVDD